jgi:hypothetical protein
LLEANLKILQIAHVIGVSSVWLDPRQFRVMNY